MSWTKTSELEFVKQINDDKFLVIEIRNSDNTYILQEVSVNLSSYSEDELNDYLEDYFPSLNQIKGQHKNDWKQILAGIIAFVQTYIEEIESKNDVRFNNEMELQFYLKKQYGIVA